MIKRSLEEIETDYGIVELDSKHQPLEGSKTYQLHLPPQVTVKDFWAVTFYDDQTSSILQTDQQFPVLDYSRDGVEQNPDGSYDVYFSPKPPEGRKNNWIQTIPGKCWFIMLSMPGPLEPWLDQVLRPGEVEQIYSLTN